MSDYPRIEVIGLTGLPEIVPGQQLGAMISEAAEAQGTPLHKDDILVVTQKVVSKAEDRLVDLNTIEPTPFALGYAEQTGKDPRLVELVLQESRSIVRMEVDRGVLITETKHGFVCANAGIDASNVPGDDMVCLLPVDSDASARRIREEIRETSGVEVAVIISDTFGRAWREGHSNFAIGVSGIETMRDYRGEIDASDKVLKVTTIAIADELAATAELVTGKTINVPVSIIRGYQYEKGDGSVGISSMVRERSRDLFR